VDLDLKALAMLVFVILFTWASVRFFRRFSGHFEDFL
jgi:hypothetical protein